MKKIVALLLFVSLVLPSCGMIPATSAETKAALAALAAETDAKIAERVAAGEDATVVMSEEVAALRAAVLDLVATASASAVTEAGEGIGDQPVTPKQGAVALALMWVLRNLRYFKAGGWPALLVGGVLPALAHKSESSKP